MNKRLKELLDGLRTLAFGLACLVTALLLIKFASPEDADKAWKLAEYLVMGGCATVGLGGLGRGLAQRKG